MLKAYIFFYFFFCKSILVAQSVTIYAENTNNGTGYVNSSGLKYSGDMKVSTTSPNGRGWAKFNLSSIPSNAKISSVTLKFYTYNSNSNSSSISNTITIFTNDPISTTGSTLYNTINNSTSVDYSTWTVSGWQTKQLKSTSYSIIESNIGKSISLGFVRGSTMLYQIFGYSNSSYKPQLIINYTVQISNPLAPNSISSDVYTGQTTCVNSKVLLTANLNYLTTLATTYWFEGGCSQNYIGQGQSIYVYPLKTTTYYARNYKDGLWSNDCAALTISVLEPPTVSKNNKVCLGDNLTLSVSGGYQTYYWSNGYHGSTQIVSPTINYTYKVTAHNNYYNCSVENSIDVVVNKLPSVFAGNDFVICDTQNIALSGSGAINYIWNNGVTNNIPFKTFETKTYTLTGTDENGCKNTDDIKVIYSKPIINYQLSNEIQGNDGEIDISISGSGPFKFDWDIDGLGDKDDSEDLINLIKGDYTIFVYDQSGCSTSQSFKIVNLNDMVIPTGVSPNNDGKNDTWEIIGSEYISDLQVQVFNLQGQLIYGQSGVYKPWDCTFLGKIIPVQEYFYKITSEKYKIEKKGYLLVNY